MIIPKTLECRLRKHMSRQEHNFNPVAHDTLIADGYWHEYSVIINGRKYKAQYIAFLNPSPTRETSLLCVYGLVNYEKYYTYLSHPQELARIIERD